MSTITFNHRGISLDGNTRQEKINSYINKMGGYARLLDYIILNLKITEENISEIEVIE